jgi:predicted PurR-regulated permease PerM
LVVIPVVVWLFFTKSFVIAIIFTILLFLVTLIDNILKPLILARGLRTPMIIIFLGVLGGVLLHGVIGVFIGPVVLAIFYDLVCHWLVAEDM